MIDPHRARAFLRIALAALVVAVFVHTRADPDLWGHVRFGGDLVASHGAPLADTYAFDSDRPWVNHEWLAEIVMYAAFRAGGGAGLIALKVLLLLAMVAAASMTMRRAAADTPSVDASHDLLIGLLVVGTVPQASHVRPQLFSLALFATLLATLVAAHRGRRAALLAIPLVMCAWANLHGGWLVGAGTLLVWSAAAFASNAVPPRDRWLFALAVIGGLTATIVNPHGWRLWAFLRETVGVGRPDIVDWQPVFEIGSAYVLLWSLVAAAAGAAMWTARRSQAFDWPASAVVAMLAAASFRINRLIAFFAIAAVLLLHREIARAMAGWRSAGRRERERGGAVAALVVAATVLTVSVVAAAKSAGCIEIDPADYPEPAVVELVKGRLHGRMVPWFGWGEYAIWHLAPDVQVSIDGRRETVYSNETIERHLRLYFVPDERRQHLAAIGPDLVWVPSRLELASGLRADGWHTLFVGARSVLLSRDPLPALDDTPPRASAARCFPGP